MSPSSPTQKRIVTVGIFDGVHAGHRYLIEQLKSLATEPNTECMVLTFAVHPRKVIHMDFQPELLTTLPEKIQLLKATGIDRCEVIDFSVEMSHLSAYEFMKNVLMERYGATTLLVGHDHRFGHNRVDGIDEYQAYATSLGLNIVLARRFITDEFPIISSSFIRQALHKGQIVSANKMLKYSYSIVGRVTNGFRLGRKVGFPTANIQPDTSEKLIPALGVYAVRVFYNDSQLDGMMNIGTRPTISESGAVSLEVNIFDFEEDIYNQQIVVSFVDRIRDEKKFTDIAELVDQLWKDKEQAIKLLIK